MILSVLFKIYTLMGMTAENFIIQEIWKTIEMQVCSKFVVQIEKEVLDTIYGIPEGYRRNLFPFRLEMNLKNRPY